MKALQSDQSGHDHNSSFSNEFRLSLAIIITLIFFFIELLGGLLSNSLALVADAGHMFQDVFALILSLAALLIAKKKSNIKYSFGYKRAEVLSSFVNGLLLIFVSLFLLIESFNRLDKPEDINIGLMFVISLVGILANVFMFLLLFQGAHHDLNIKGAVLHIAGDTLGSLGALLASVLIYFTGNVFFDILITLFITILISISAFNLLRQSIRILMEGTPANLDLTSIQTDLSNLDGVKAIHDVHIWSASSQDCLFSCHIVADKDSDPINLIKAINNHLSITYQINHATIQVEHDSYSENCVKCDSEVERSSTSEDVST